MSRIVVLRHGNTFAPGEPPRRVGKGTDLPLVASGRSQAIAAGQALKSLGWQPSFVGVSSLRRTQETAVLALDAMGIDTPQAILPFLDEVDHGPDENQLEEDVVRRVGRDALDAWDRESAPPSGWIVNPEERIAAWRSFVTQRIGLNETALLVTSNGAARFCLLAVQGSLAGQPLPSLKLRTGAWGVLDVSTDQVVVQSWDQRPDEVSPSERVSS